MAKVYALTPELQKDLPQITGGNYNWDNWQKDQDEFIKKATAWAKARNPQDDLAGMHYEIGHADGAAQYIVLSSKPVQLMHLPIGDAWDSPWADRTRKSDLVQYKKWEEKRVVLFGKKEEPTALDIGAFEEMVGYEI